MELSEIINIIFGGGLIATTVAIVTLRATVRKANADAEKAVADAETVRVDNAEHATRVLVENIVKPLKEELNETRKCLEASKREMARLRKAIDTANSCKHHDDCPVLVGVREQSKKHDGQDGDGGDSAKVKRGGRQHAARAPDNKEGGSTCGQRGADNQP